MAGRYKMELIPIEEKDRLMKEYQERVLYEERADIYGCCIKLLTENRYVKERWEENFYPMSANVRSHGRLVVMDEEDKPLRVRYNPLSKTAFLTNVDYYGWIKSLALSVAGDVLEDEHGINSIHGACVDVDGRGLGLIAPSGTGKTTHTYGLLRHERVRVVSDDWFFVRLYGRDALAFGSEKNFYVQADIAEIWGEYEDLVERAEFDKQGRAVVNVRWIVGKGRIIPMTTVRTMIILRRDPNDEKVIQRLEPEEALSDVVQTDFCNPHLLVKDDRKQQMRKDFFQRLFEVVDLYSINTVMEPIETHRRINGIIDSSLD